jgi:predicted dinucleotide-binding enzyme
MSLPLTLALEDDTPTVELVEQVHPSSVAEQDTQTVVQNSQNSDAVVAAAVVVVAVEVSAAIAE